MFHQNCVKYQKRLSVVGTMLMVMPGAADWFWGSMSVYALSFVVSRNSFSGIEIPWLISIYFIFWSAGVNGSDLMAKILSRRCIMFIGSVVLNCGLLSSYFSVQHSLSMLTLSIGIMVAFGQGVVYGNSIHIVVQSATDDMGFLTGLLPASFLTGALLISQMVTWYVNPQNLSPNLSLGVTKYFTQKDIIDRVPSMFFVLLAFALLSHTLGFILLQFNPDITFVKCFFTQSTEENMFLAGCEVPFHDNFRTLHANNAESNGSICPSSSYDRKEDFTPKDILKSMKFYTLCTSVLITDYSIILLVNFYKLFGQIWIHDDHFLSDIGMMFILSIVVLRIPLGIALDKFGLRNCMAMLTCVAVIAISWYYITAVVSKWCYLLASIAYGAAIGCIHCTYLTSMAVMFGKTHISANFGILMTFSSASNILVPFIIKIILTNCGWFQVFTSAALLDVISLFMWLKNAPGRLANVMS